MNSGKTEGIKLNEMLEMLSFGIRLSEPFVALIVIIMCFVSLKGGRREEKALIALESETDDKTYPVLYWENSIGRSRSSDIRINDFTVSRDHAVLLRRNDGWFINDTGSKAGVFVNGQKTDGRWPVAVGDNISLGSTSLVLRRASDVGVQTAVREPKRFPQGVIVAFITLYQALLTLQAAINMMSAEVIIPSALFLVVMWAFYGVSKLGLRRLNFELESLALLLSGTGIILAASHDMKQSFVQLAAMVLGIFLYSFMLWFIEIPDRVMKWNIAIAILALLMLASTLVLGKSLNGAKNWIVLGPVSVQPSEFAKIAYIFVGASTLDVLQTKKSLASFIVISILSVGFLVLMSDFGTAVIFFMTFLIIAFMRSGDIKTVILAVSAAGIGAMTMLSVKPYIADRFAVWGHVWDYADGTGYQQVRSLIYSASGGLFGTGLSKGYLQYLFASENDLVFCLICEELGCIIAVLCAVVIGGLMIYARGVTTRSRSTFYSIAACYAGGLLVFQSALNIFGVVDILPLTGVTLPFVSYGGTSMAACWGLLSFIKAADERTYARHIPKQKKAPAPEEMFEQI